jgi:hypothetical protein
VSNFIIWGNTLVALTAKAINFDDFKSGGLHENHAVATISAFTLI